jgi:hypothetical protein
MVFSMSRDGTECNVENSEIMPSPQFPILKLWAARVGKVKSEQTRVQLRIARLELGHLESWLASNFPCVHRSFRSVHLMLHTSAKNPQTLRTHKRAHRHDSCWPDFGQENQSGSSGHGPPHREKIPKRQPWIWTQNSVVSKTCLRQKFRKLQISRDSKHEACKVLQRWFRLNSYHSSQRNTPERPNQNIPSKKYL